MDFHSRTHVPSLPHKRRMKTTLSKFLNAGIKQSPINIYVRARELLTLQMWLEYYSYLPWPFGLGIMGNLVQWCWGHAFSLPMIINSHRYHEPLGCLQVWSKKSSWPWRCNINQVKLPSHHLNSSFWQVSLCPREPDGWKIKRHNKKGWEGKNIPVFSI